VTADEVELCLAGDLEPVVRLLFESEGYRVRASETSVLISDRLLRSGTRAVVQIVEPIPPLCRSALDLILGARLHGAVLRTELHLLPHAARSAQRELCVVSRGVAQLAARSPQLSARQRDVLRLLSEGAVTREIASEVCASQATVKRELRVLCAAFGVRTRFQLALVVGESAVFRRDLQEPP
jgi:DNA-binding NarL/FixJ family response regulator